MKALRVYAPEDVRHEEVPEPRFGSERVELRIRAQNLNPLRTIGDTEEP